MDSYVGSEEWVSGFWTILNVGSEEWGQIEPKSGWILGVFTFDLKSGCRDSGLWILMLDLKSGCRDSGLGFLMLDLKSGWILGDFHIRSEEWVSGFWTLDS